jgi:hypothetical protein
MGVASSCAPVSVSASAAHRLPGWAGPGGAQTGRNSPNQPLNYPSTCSSHPDTPSTDLPMGQWRNLNCVERQVRAVPITCPDPLHLRSNLAWCDPLGTKGGCLPPTKEKGGCRRSSSISLTFNPLDLPPTSPHPFGAHPDLLLLPLGDSLRAQVYFLRCASTEGTLFSLQVQDTWRHIQWS